MQLTELAHRFLEAHLSVGSTAIDATAGNGHDTLKMSKLVGTSGQVIAMDIQTSAINSTRNKLTCLGVSNFKLIEGDHAEVLSSLVIENAAKASAITFNLGYLPGSDKRIQTNSSSTIPALNSALDLLAPNGVLLVTAYRGHAGGLDEAGAVEKWMLQKQAEGYEIESKEPKAIRIPPILWVLKHSD
ncbi:MAG: tRNA (mnm(5)s(2)U34)-methyltransferase [Opitutaceae bacterium]